MSLTDSKSFFLAAIAMSTAVWEITFNLGVFNTVFFEHSFAVWVASTAAILASFFIQRPQDQPLFAWRGRFVLALPTVWLIVVLVADVKEIPEGADDIVYWISVATVLITLPYLLYVIVLMVTPDLIDIKDSRLLWALAGIVIVIGLIGYAVGVKNELFLSCHDFQISGNDLPGRCKAEEMGSRSVVIAPTNMTRSGHKPVRVTTPQESMSRRLGFERWIDRLLYKFSICPIPDLLS